MLLTVLKWVLLCVAAYLLGSVTFATIIAKKQAGLDIRTVGSRNSGMSNMVVTLGPKAGFLTLLGDAGKGAAAVLLAFLLFGFDSIEIAALAAFLAMLGHIYPVFFKFKGGKGTAVMGGAILALQPLLFIIIIVSFIAILLITKYIAYSTIFADLIYPAGMLLFFWHSPNKWWLLPLCLGVSILSISKHIENLKHIKNNEEQKFALDMLLKTKSG
ncbi:MAG: glycerol-3-phosphate 1-O-acyltransferase PlsY [Oscillospiraceae bacterium]|jgi:glycerol-3-phosphate acyltransferase PlsY|nr:glycerol-3-phosphate 1-O-acyltransferase PlsY [Oscillospiraceae bacterium]